MAGALVRPNGITTYSNKPIGVKKTVLCSCPSFMHTWWYAKVNGTEYSGLTKLVKKVMDTRYRKHVQMHLLIQTTEIDTHAKLTGLFAYEEDGCTLR